MKPVLILGGYGNFGKRIARQLVGRGVGVVIAGRDGKSAQDLATDLGNLAQATGLDVMQGIAGALKEFEPVVVINTCGPFQGAGYDVARECIRAGINYIDLADGREFVTGIVDLDQDAGKAGVSVISGASTVPALSSAVVEHFRHEFDRIDTLSFGISPGQKAERGLATTRGILSYVGRPLKAFRSFKQPAYGWQDIYRQDFPGLGKRWMANCEIPDLDLLPERYGIGKIRFSAGLELSALHLGLWGLSWLVRAGLPVNLPRYSESLLAASNWFDRFGSADGGMHVVLEGAEKDGQPHRREWYVIARDGYGPYIPTIPAVLLAEGMARGERFPNGAYPCLGLISLEAYIGALADWPITVSVRQVSG